MSEPFSIVAFEAKHAIALLCGGVMECGMKVAKATPFMERIAGQYESAGWSITVLVGDVPLFTVLVTILWPGVAAIHAMFSQKIVEHKVVGLRAARKVLELIFQKYRLHRLQTTVRRDFPQGQRFAEWIGFIPEGIARKHSHDQVDAIYYAIVR